MRLAHMKIIVLVRATILVCLVAACGTVTPPQPVSVASPTPDAASEAYVALIHNFWIQEQAADVVADGSNLAARACLGVDPPGAPTKLALIVPLTCRERAIALLSVHEKFLRDLDGTPAPPKFAADDQIFRTQLPRTITDLKALISAAGSRSKDAVLQAATVYNDDMYPSVTGAMNDVDPAVRHP